MDYGMIGKIEKAKRYAQQPERITFQSFSANFKGDNSTYHVSLSPEGWDCTCAGFATQGICPHVMCMEKLFKPMIKRDPLRYAPGQNVVSDVDKAMRYADEPDRIEFQALEVTFAGENSAHHTTYADTAWQCDCSFFASRGVCCHTMAMERVLKDMVTTAMPIVG